MVGWIILGVIVLIVFCINMIRIGADVAYENGEFRLAAKVAGIRLQLIPKEDREEKPKKEKKPKKKKKEKKKKEKKQEEGEEQPKKKSLPLGMNLEELFDAAKAILGHIARFPRKFLIDHFKLHVVMAGIDPYDTARQFGWLNEALSILHPLAQKGFRVRNSDVRTEIDFVRDRIGVEFAMGLTIRIGQIVGLLNAIIISAVKVVIRSKRRQKKERKAAEKEAKLAQAALPPEGTEKPALPSADAETAENIKKEENDKDIKSEERTDSNG